MIIFEKIRWMNLLSTGNVFTEILLNKSPSTLVVGTNGAGKSTFLDALNFALFGRPFRNINKPQLINTITNKNLLVELEFSTNGKQYLIRRGIKPNLFEIHVDSVLINEKSSTIDYQDYLEKNILRFNSKTFKQIVVLGSADYVPFMQLNTQSRAKVIEDLLDIQIFSSMGILLREHVSRNKVALHDNGLMQQSVSDRIGVHKQHLQQIAADKDTQLADLDKRIASYQQLNAQYADQIQKLSTDLERASRLQKQKEQLSKQLIQGEQFLTRYSDNRLKISDQIDFFKVSESCPTCHQPITEESRQDNLNQLGHKITILDGTKETASEEIARLKQQLATVRSELETVSDLISEIHALSASITSNKAYITELQSQKDIVSNRNQNSEATINDIEKLEEEKIRLTAEAARLKEEREILIVSQNLLKDGGIKTQIIRQYVPIINTLIAKYLASLDFFVHFEINENFEETIKSRYRDTFSYASFSEGEKTRLDLALMMTWRAIAKMRNSAATNLLIMDEVFDSSLDSAGTDELLKIFDTLGDSTNIFCISHKGDQLFDKFHSTIRFEKHKNFSKIATNP